MKREKWKCLDCKIDTGKISEHYFVHTDIWLSAAKSIRGMLCIGCLERRLQRPLTATDFTSCYLNDTKRGMKSQRFLDRLTSV